MDGVASLNSAQRETAWAQRRAVLGHWRTPEDSAVSLRVRVLKAGQDFSSALLYTQQRGQRLLCGMGLATDQGDGHCTLDKPADGIFPLEDLRLRISLQ